MRAKLPPGKKRVRQIAVPVNDAEEQAVKAIAEERGISVAQVFREAVRRECQAMKGPKKTKAA